MVIKKFILYFKKYSITDIFLKGFFKISRTIYHIINGFCIDTGIYRFFMIRMNKFYYFIPDFHFFFSVNEKPHYLDLMERYDRIPQIIHQADQVCRHVFNLLGSGTVNLGNRINWQKDFKSGFAWPLIYFHKVLSVIPEDGADIKVPWELSRFQHVTVLGQAYWLTEDPVYVEEFMHEIKNWIDDNPYEKGVNWVCSMDVAIRAINWIIGYFYFKNSPYINLEFWTVFHHQLYVAAIHIRKNLEYNHRKHGSNHLLTNFAGLVWLGIYFKGFSSAAFRWLMCGIKGLIREMQYQIHLEGTDFEASLPYHRLVTEIFLSTVILIEKNGIRFPAPFITRLANMCEFVMAYTKPNGHAPQIGDADDGRLHIFSGYGKENKQDHRHILGVAGEYFDRDDFRLAAGDQLMDAVWLCGRIKKPYRLPAGGVPLMLSYPEMGYYLIRDPNVYLLIRCGKIDPLCSGSHAHNDQLSFELNYQGRDIFIDPGTYLYTADPGARNQFRSTASHNTAMVNQTEQNMFDPLNIFYLNGETNARMLIFERRDQMIIWSGEHFGYKKQFGVVHLREFRYHPYEHSLLINDFFSGNPEIITSLILHQTAVYEPIDDMTLKINSNITVKLNTPYQLEDAWQSDSYGLKTLTKKIIVKTGIHIQTEIHFF